MENKFNIAELRNKVRRRVPLTQAEYDALVAACPKDAANADIITSE